MGDQEIYTCRSHCNLQGKSEEDNVVNFFYC